MVWSLAISVIDSPKDLVSLSLEDEPRLKFYIDLHSNSLDCKMRDFILFISYIYQFNDESNSN